MKKAVLKTGGGKYVQVRRNKQKEVKLCAVDSQDHDTSVFIQTRKKDDTMQMAFQFKYGDEYYSPKVEGADIKLEKVPVPEKPLTLECHWFERVNMQSGEVYSLKSVVETPQYVTIQTDGSPLSLTTEPWQCLYIKDERVRFHSVEICRLAKNLQGINYMRHQDHKSLFACTQVTITESCCFIFCQIGFGADAWCRSPTKLVGLLCVLLLAFSD